MSSAGFSLLPDAHVSDPTDELDDASTLHAVAKEPRVRIAPRSTAHSDRT